MQHFVYCTMYTVYLCIGFKVVVQHVNTDGEVSSVVWIGAVPSLWTKLPALYHNRMKVDQGEENALELTLTRAHLKRVLWRWDEEIAIEGRELDGPYIQS